MRCGYLLCAHNPRNGVPDCVRSFALNELSRVLADRPEPAYELFLSFDTDGDGKVCVGLFSVATQ